MPENADRQEYPEKLRIVREFIGRYVSHEPVESDDPAGDCICFALGNGRTFAVTADFLAVFSDDEVRENLMGWNVAHYLRTLQDNSRLTITSEGTEVEPDPSR